MDNWTVKYRRYYGFAQADSIQESDGTGHEYDYVQINDSGVMTDFNTITGLKSGIWIETDNLDLSGVRPDAVEFLIQHVTKYNDSDANDSARVIMKIHGSKN